MFKALGILLSVLGGILLFAGVSHADGTVLKGYTDCTWSDAGGNESCNPPVYYEPANNYGVPQAVAGLREWGDIMGFRMGDKDVAAPDPTHKRHWQGVQRLAGENAEYLIVTMSRFSEEYGGFAVVEMKSRDVDGFRFRSNRLGYDLVEETPPPSEDEIVKYVEIPSPYDPDRPDRNHAGGFQVIGDYAAIPMECYEWNKCEDMVARVVFYDLGDPINPSIMPYDVQLSGMGDEENSKHAGTTSITKLADGRYLLIVGGYDAKPLWFFISENSSLAADPKFEFRGVKNPNNWEPYQNINIVNDSAGNMYLVCMHKKSNEDHIDVHSLGIVEEINGELSITIQKVANRHVHSQWGNMERQCDLHAAAGVYVDPRGGLIVYATENDNDGPRNSDSEPRSVKMMEFRHQEFPYAEHNTATSGIWGETGIPAWLPQGSWVELYDDDNWGDRGLMMDFVDRNMEEYANFNNVEKFGGKASSARWRIKDGYRFCYYEDEYYEPQNQAVCLHGIGEDRGRDNGNESGINLIKPKSGIWEYCPDWDLDWDYWDCDEWTRLIVDVDAGRAQTVIEGEEVFFSGSVTVPGSTNGLTIEWDFGDGSPTKTDTLTTSHIYGDDGAYTVILKVTDEFGNWSVDYLTVTVNNEIPELMGSTISLPYPHFIFPGHHTLTFDATVKDPGSDDITFEWGWGDGTTPNTTVYYNDGLSPDPYPSPDISPVDVTDTAEHVYALPGDYTVTLTVIDDDGGSVTKEVQVTVAAAFAAKEAIFEVLVDLLPQGSQRDAKHIKKAIRHLEKSLNDEYWETDSTLTKKGRKVFKKDKKTVRELMKIVKGEGEYVDEAQAAIDGLVEIDRLLARTAIDDALAACSAVGDAKGQAKCQKEIDKANEKMAKAYKDLDKGKPDKAIDHYKKAWEHAQKALKKLK